MDKAAAERICSNLRIFDERQTRIYLALEAKIIGFDGIAQVSKISGDSKATIIQGLKELNQQTTPTTNTIPKKAENTKKTQTKTAKQTKKPKNHP